MFIRLPVCLFLIVEGDKTHSLFPLDIVRDFGIVGVKAQPIFIVGLGRHWAKPIKMPTERETSRKTGPKSRPATRQTVWHKMRQTRSPDHVSPPSLSLSLSLSSFFGTGGQRGWWKRDAKKREKKKNGRKTSRNSQVAIDQAEKRASFLSPPPQLLRLELILD